MTEQSIDQMQMSPAPATVLTSGSEDIPLATVKTIGVTEVTSGLVLLGALLTIVFGHDWGISANAVKAAPQVIEVVTTGLAIARAIKHVGISHANAKVLVAHATTAQALPLLEATAGRHELPAAAG